MMADGNILYIYMVWLQTTCCRSYRLWKTEQAYGLVEHFKREYVFVFLFVFRWCAHTGCGGAETNCAVMYVYNVCECVCCLYAFVCCLHCNTCTHQMRVNLRVCRSRNAQRKWRCIFYTHSNTYSWNACCYIWLASVYGRLYLGCTTTTHRHTRVVYMWDRQKVLKYLMRSWCIPKT